MKHQRKVRRVHRKKLIPIKWLGTVLCTVGIALTSFNVFPLNITVMFVGTAIWCAAGILQRDWPLASGEIVSILLYGSGIVFYTVQALSN